MVVRVGFGMIFAKFAQHGHKPKFSGEFSARLQPNSESGSGCSGNDLQHHQSSNISLTHFDSSMSDFPFQWHL